MSYCSDCDQPDQVRGSEQRGLAVRHPGREQQPGDDLSPQEEKSREERRWETAVESCCMIVNHSYQCQVAQTFSAIKDNQCFTKILIAVRSFF